MDQLLSVPAEGAVDSLWAEFLLKPAKRSLAQELVSAHPRLARVAHDPSLLAAVIKRAEARGSVVFWRTALWLARMGARADDSVLQALGTSWEEAAGGGLAEIIERRLRLLAEGGEGGGAEGGEEDQEELGEEQGEWSDGDGEEGEEEG